nr:hypothetical protein [Tanacetum cinerariifolium]
MKDDIKKQFDCDETRSECEVEGGTNRRFARAWIRVNHGPTYQVCKLIIWILSSFLVASAIAPFAGSLETETNGRNVDISHSAVTISF